MYKNSYISSHNVHVNTLLYNYELTKILRNDGLCIISVIPQIPLFMGISNLSIWHIMCVQSGCSQVPFLSVGSATTFLDTDGGGFGVGIGWPASLESMGVAGRFDEGCG